MSMVIAATDTRTQILDVAQALVQEMGYNGMSYRDLADKIGIKTASIHYHFPSKGDLGKHLVLRYRSAFNDLRNMIDAGGGSPADKLQGFASQVVDAFRKGQKMCLCGIMAAESSSLPVEVQEEVRGFFRDNETWFTSLLAAGREVGQFRFAGSPEAVGRSLFASVEGAITTAWTFRDPERLAGTLEFLIGSIQLR